MTTRDTPFAPGTPCWVDLLTSDPDKARSFYGALLGWTSEDGGEEFGGYVSFASDGHGVGGMMRNTPEMGSPDGWTTYISTDDIDATVNRATEAGGTVMSPAMAVADLGSMAVLVDPVGAVFGVWQPGKHTGFAKYNGSLARRSIVCSQATSTPRRDSSCVRRSEYGSIMSFTDR